MSNILVIKQNAGKIEIAEFREDDELDTNRKIFDFVSGYELLEDVGQLYDKVKTALIYEGDLVKFEISLVEL